MSKQSEARKAQNYKEPKEVGMCHNCHHFTSDIEYTQFGGIEIESKLRCSLGRFAVKKTSSCDLQIEV
jgi:hypothetical protein